MHASNPPPAYPPTPKEQPEKTSACPIMSTDSPFYASQEQQQQQPSPPQQPTETKPSTLSKLNPLNYMFAAISQERAPNQIVDLPVDRELSSIPRGDSSGNWEYPSPQQMYNAMLRKGYTDTPQDAVESMVAVHNFLNEGAWNEIVGWERVFGSGLKRGWEKCKRGEENIAMDALREEILGSATGHGHGHGGEDEDDDDDNTPRLLRFQGRPKELTPKAQMMQTLGWLYPAKFEYVPINQDIY